MSSNLFEILLTPYIDYDPIQATPEDNSKEGLRLFEKLLSKVTPPLISLIKTQINPSDFTIYFKTPKWEEECIPGTGGDGYRCKAILTKLKKANT